MQGDQALEPAEQAGKHGEQQGMQQRDRPAAAGETRGFGTGRRGEGGCC